MSKAKKTTTKTNAKTSARVEKTSRYAVGSHPWQAKLATEAKTTSETKRPSVRKAFGKNGVKGNSVTQSANVLCRTGLQGADAICKAAKAPQQGVWVNVREAAFLSGDWAVKVREGRKCFYAIAETKAAADKYRKAGALVVSAYDKAKKAA